MRSCLPRRSGNGCRTARGVVGLADILARSLLAGRRCQEAATRARNPPDESDAAKIGNTRCPDMQAGRGHAFVRRSRVARVPPRAPKKCRPFEVRAAVRGLGNVALSEAGPLAMAVRMRAAGERSAR